MIRSNSNRRDARPKSRQPMKIVFNGEEFDSIEQMPPAVRQQYQSALGALRDGDGDGVPDALQHGGAGSVVVRESSFYNGREYKDRSELPPEARQALEQMPPPKPDEVQTRVEVKTKTLPTQVNWSLRTAETASGRSGSRQVTSWLIITVLLGLVLLLLCLWLSGIKPGDVFRR